MQLERLKKFGLVFAYGKDRGLVYSAHPFLRDFFRNLLAASPEAVHESVRARLAPTLEVSPRELSRDPAILDRYELLIEETLLAGKVQEAFDLYRDRLGNVRHLRSVGEIARGLRILERFAPQDDFSGAVSQLLQRDQSILASSLGFFAMYVGDLSRARRAHHYALEIDRQASDAKGQSIHNENLADLELLAGNFPLAADYAQRAVLLAGQDDEPWRISAKMSFRASVVAALGEMEEAANLFKRASEIEGAILYSLNGVLEAEFKALRGLRQEAISQTENNRQVAIKYGWGEDLCRCDALLARFCTDDPVRASSHLADARAFASRSGIVELQLAVFTPRASCSARSAIPRNRSRRPRPAFFLPIPAASASTRSICVWLSPRACSPQANLPEPCRTLARSPRPLSVSRLPVRLGPGRRAAPLRYRPPSTWRARTGPPKARCGPRTAPAPRPSPHRRDPQRPRTIEMIWASSSGFRSARFPSVNKPATGRAAGGRGSRCCRARTSRSGGRGACARCAWRCPGPGRGPDRAAWW
jgi:tetratricopeptide (TPR) repeat protein